VCEAGAIDHIVTDAAPRLAARIAIDEAAIA
jgi:hypothetical protein